MIAIVNIIVMIDSIIIVLLSLLSSPSRHHYMYCYSTCFIYCIALYVSERNRALKLSVVKYRCLSKGRRFKSLW